ncbi:MAG: PAS domain S-box protein [Anaerolineaceae bacterium]
MAGQLTKILICTASQDNAKRYYAYLKKYKTIKYEINIENNPQNLIPTLQKSNSDLLIFDQASIENRIDVLTDFLTKGDRKVPCLIIANQSIKNSFQKLVMNNPLFFIIPEDWVDDQIINLSIQRLLNLQNKGKEIENWHQTDESLLNKISGMVFRRKDNKRGTLVYISEGSKDLTGYTAADLINNHEVSYFDLINPNDREMVRDSVQHQIAKNSYYQISYRILDFNKNIKWVRESGIEFHSVDSDEKMIEGLILDISDQMAMMEELQKKRSQLQNIYDYVLVGLGSIEKRIFIEVNDYFCELFGYDRSEIVGHSTELIYSTKEDFKFFGRENAENLDKKGFGSFYTTLKRKDGSPIYVLVTTSNINKNDKEGLISFAILDITKQTESKRLLQENEEKSRGIIKHMNEGVFLSDENGIVVEWSDAMEKLIAIPKKEVLGISFYQVVDLLVERAVLKIEGEKVKQFLKETFEDQSPIRYDKTWEGELLTPQGVYKIFQAELFTIKTPNGNRLTIIVRDIDDQKRHEKELLSLVNLASVIRKSSNDAILIRRSVCDILMSLLDLGCIAMAAFRDNSDLGSITEIRGSPKDKIGETVSWKNCVNQQRLYNDSVFEISESCLEQFYDRDKVSDLPLTRISIPLVNGNNRMGMIFIFHKNAFSEYEYRLLDAMANIVASALSQALAFERTELRLKRLESLHVVDQAISGLFNLDLTNRIILDQAKQQLGADGGDILILNMATNMMEYSAIFGFDQLDVDEKRVHLSRSMAGQVLLNREPCILHDASKKELPFVMKHLQRHGFKAYFGFPLIAKGEPKGVIEIYMKNPFQPDAEWLNFLQSLTTQASIAVDNIQLFEKMQNIQYNPI